MMNRLRLLNLARRPIVVDLVNSYTTNQFPYTSELVRRKFLRYPAQTKAEVTHDYVYDEGERLPDLKARLDEFKDPLEEVAQNIGHLVGLPNKSKLKNELHNLIKVNKTNKNLELEAKEMKSKTNKLIEIVEKI